MTKTGMNALPEDTAGFRFTVQDQDPLNSGIPGAKSGAHSCRPATNDHHIIIAFHPAQHNYIDSFTSSIV